MNPNIGSSIRYDHKNKQVALNLVHLHIYEYAQRPGNNVIIPAGALKQIAFTSKDKGATAASHAITGFGIQGVDL